MNRIKKNLNAYFSKIARVKEAGAKNLESHSGIDLKDSYDHLESTNRAPGVTANANIRRLSSMLSFSNFLSQSNILRYSLDEPGNVNGRRTIDLSDSESEISDSNFLSQSNILRYSLDEPGNANGRRTIDLSDSESEVSYVSEKECVQINKHDLKKTTLADYLKDENSNDVLSYGREGPGNISAEIQFAPSSPDSTNGNHEFTFHVPDEAPESSKLSFPDTNKNEYNPSRPSSPEHGDQFLTRILSKPGSEDLDPGILETHGKCRNYYKPKNDIGTAAQRFTSNIFDSSRLPQDLSLFSPNVSFASTIFNMNSPSRSNMDGNFTAIEAKLGNLKSAFESNEFGKNVKNLGKNHDKFIKKANKLIEALQKSIDSSQVIAKKKVEDQIDNIKKAKQIAELNEFAIRDKVFIFEKLETRYCDMKGSYVNIFGFPPNMEFIQKELKKKNAYLEQLIEVMNTVEDESRKAKLQNEINVVAADRDALLFQFGVNTPENERCATKLKTSMEKEIKGFNSVLSKIQNGKKGYPAFIAMLLEYKILDDFKPFKPFKRKERELQEQYDYLLQHAVNIIQHIERNCGGLGNMAGIIQILKHIDNPGDINYMKILEAPAAYAASTAITTSYYGSVWDKKPGAYKFSGDAKLYLLWSNAVLSYFKVIGDVFRLKHGLDAKKIAETAITEAEKNAKKDAVIEILLEKAEQNKTGVNAAKRDAVYKHLMLLDSCKETDGLLPEQEKRCKMLEELHFIYMMRLKTGVQTMNRRALSTVLNVVTGAGSSLAASAKHSKVFYGAPNALGVAAQAPKNAMNLTRLIKFVGRDEAFYRAFGKYNKVHPAVISVLEEKSEAYSEAIKDIEKGSKPNSKVWNDNEKINAIINNAIDNALDKLRLFREQPIYKDEKEWSAFVDETVGNNISQSTWEAVKNDTNSHWFYGNFDISKVRPNKIAMVDRAALYLVGMFKDFVKSNDIDVLEALASDGKRILQQASKDGHVVINKKDIPLPALELLHSSIKDFSDIMGLLNPYMPEITFERFIGTEYAVQSHIKNKQLLTKISRGKEIKNNNVNTVPVKNIANISGEKAFDADVLKNYSLMAYATTKIV